MAGVSLYPPQQSFVASIREAMKSFKYILAQAPTGFGKSWCLAFIILSAFLKGKKVYLVVPRRELLRQMSSILNEINVEYSYIAAGYFHNPFALVQICSLQTLIKRLDQINKADLVIIDEGHIGGEGMDKVIDRFKNVGAYILSFSATPWKLNGEGLKKYYDHMVCGPSVRWLIDNKYLSDYRAFAPSSPDLSMIKTVAGDYARGPLDEKMSQDRVLIGSAVDHYKKHAMGKLNIAFCVSRKHSEIVADSFRCAGVPALSMDGETPDAERVRIIKAYAKREILVLVNCDLCTYGFDLSAQCGMDVTIEAMSDLRPTKSLALQMQKNGRVLRKKDYPALIFDHSSNIAIHGRPCQDRVWSLEDREKQGRGGGEKTLPVAQCSFCYFCFSPVPVCPNCGKERPVLSREIKEVAGELSEIEIEAQKKTDRMEVGRAKTIADLERIARERGYAKGWIYRQMKLKGIMA